MKNYVVLVDSSDTEIGLMEKYEAHEKGLLHRAISVCLVDKDGKWLLQRRALTKYHSPGFIANACCSHPFQGEQPIDAAIRRVQEELNISLEKSRLQPVGRFIYREDVGQGLIEHELDYLFFGTISRDEVPAPNPDEVHELIWMAPQDIQKSIEKGDLPWAAWFPHIFAHFLK